MKNIVNLFLFIFTTIFLISCSDDTNDVSSLTTKSEDLITIEQSFIVDGLQQTMSDDELDFTITATFDFENEKVVEYRLSDDFLTYYNVTHEDIHAFFIREISENYMDLNITSTNPDYEIYLSGGDDDDETICDVRPKSHSCCMHLCDESHLDADGQPDEHYNRCRGRCWVDTGVTILTLGLANLFS